MNSALAILWKFPLLLAALVMLAGQPYFCGTPDAVSPLCAHAASGGCGEAPQPADGPEGDASPNGCDHAGCAKSLSAPDPGPVSLASARHGTDAHPAPDRFPPDSPVAEIEHPPQLS